VCPTGSTSVAGGACTCEEGSYADAGGAEMTCLSCPAGAESRAGARGIEDCFCGRHAFGTITAEVCDMPHENPMNTKP